MKTRIFTFLGFLLAFTFGILTSCNEEPTRLKGSTKVDTIKDPSRTDDEVDPPITKGNLMDVFLNMDVEILRSGDEDKVKNYLIAKNVEIKDYLILNYPGRDAENLDINDPDFTGIAIMFAVLEKNNFDPKESARAKGWASCAIGVVMGMFDVVGLYQEYAVLINGQATLTTAWRIVKGMIKRYAGWFGVALAIAEIIDEC